MQLFVQSVFGSAPCANNDIKQDNLIGAIIFMTITAPVSDQFPRAARSGSVGSRRAGCIVCVVSDRFFRASAGFPTQLLNSLCNRSLRAIGPAPRYGFGSS